MTKEPKEEPKPIVSQFPKTLRNPLISSLPAHLKDPANYEKIQKVILESLAGTHSHGEVAEWAACVSCQRRFTERSNVMQKLGFTSPAQYMAWKKTHEFIAKRMPLR